MRCVCDKIPPYEKVCFTRSLKKSMEVFCCVYKNGSHPKKRANKFRIYCCVSWKVRLCHTIFIRVKNKRSRNKNDCSAFLTAHGVLCVCHWGIKDTALPNGWKAAYRAKCFWFVYEDEEISHNTIQKFCLQCVGVKNETFVHL